jgi:hypothetical protein
MRERSPLYSELEGLLLQSEIKHEIEKSRDELEEVMYVRTQRGSYRPYNQG